MGLRYTYSHISFLKKTAPKQSMSQVFVPTLFNNSFNVGLLSPLGMGNVMYVYGCTLHSSVQDKGRLRPGSSSRLKSYISSELNKVRMHLSGKLDTPTTYLIAL